METLAFYAVITAALVVWTLFCFSTELRGYLTLDWPRLFAPALSVRNLTLLAGVYVCSRYLGDFTSQQSALLTAIAWVGYRLYEGLKAPDTFSPFSVCIHPNWYTLLSDFKLIRTEDEWRKLCETVNKIPAGEYTALRDGFVFTVIKPPGEDDLLPRLTFWDNRKVFLTTMELSEPIIPIDVGFFPPLPREEKEHPFFHHPEGTGLLPSFCFKPGVHGYEIGLEVGADWWRKQISENKDWRIKEDFNGITGTSRLIIATLPYLEFDLYCQDIDYNKNYNRARKFLQKFEGARDKKLEENGWKRHQWDLDAEVPDPWSHVEHKYMTVSHRSI